VGKKRNVSEKRDFNPDHKNSGLKASKTLPITFSAWAEFLLHQQDKI
jgi:hypothetical protein